MPKIEFRKTSVASIRRARTIQRLLQGLKAVQELQAEEIDDWLICPPSATRRYLRDLLNARIIYALPESIVKDCTLTRYSLCAEPGVLERLLQWKPEMGDLCMEIAPVELEVDSHVLGSRKASRIRVNRDPLVEALFGPATTTLNTQR